MSDYEQLYEGLPTVTPAFTSGIVRAIVARQRASVAKVVRSYPTLDPCPWCAWRCQHPYRTPRSLDPYAKYSPLRNQRLANQKESPRDSIRHTSLRAVPSVEIEQCVSGSFGDAGHHS